MMVKERMAKGPWKAHGKFVEAPGETDTYSGVVWGTIVVCHPCADTDAEGRFWSTDGSANGHARFIAAAGTAAHEVAQMGYDPVGAVRALPELLEVLKHHRATVEKWCHYQGNTQQTFDTHLGPIDAVLTRAAGKEGDDV